MDKPQTSPIIVRAIAADTLGPLAYFRLIGDAQAWVDKQNRNRTPDHPLWATVYGCPKNFVIAPLDNTTWNGEKI